MLKLFVAAFSLVVLAANGAYAATFRLGVPPVAQVTIPDSWKPGRTDDGIEANSPDGEIYLSLEVKSLGDLEKAFMESFTWIEGKGVKIDTRTQVEAEGDINDFPVFRVIVKGKDKDGYVNTVAVTALKANDNTFMVMTAWGYEGSEKKNATALKRILDSLKRP